MNDPDATKPSLTEVSMDTFRKIFDVNYLSVVETTKEALPHIRKAKGSVLYVSSASGKKRVLQMPEITLFILLMQFPRWRRLVSRTTLRRPL